MCWEGGSVFAKVDPCYVPPPFSEVFHEFFVKKMSTKEENKKRYVTVGIERDQIRA